MSSFALILWLKKSQAVWWGRSSLKMPVCLLARKAMWGPDEKWQKASCSGPTSCKFHILQMEPLAPLGFICRALWGPEKGEGRMRSRETDAGFQEVLLEATCVLAQSTLAPHLLASVMANGKLERTAHQPRALSSLETVHFLPVLVWDHFVNREEWF